ncbi:MAG: 3-hydroxyacyl-CoA dehydrogenase NAD-binding domain-containing protein, partial [Aeoliella sp.]
MSVSTVGVVGLGLLGRGICAALLGNGLRVVGVDLDSHYVDQARKAIDTALREMIEHDICKPAVAKNWMEPAYATRFLELIRGGKTGDAPFRLAKQLAERCGKQPCTVNKDVQSFIINRL